VKCVQMFMQDLQTASCGQLAEAERGVW
jgi:hypothetical protein